LRSASELPIRCAIATDLSRKRIEERRTVGEEWSILGKRASEYLRTDDVLVDFNI